MARKLRFGWFSFSCCEDSTIVFTELLNDHFHEWVEKIEFCHVRILKKENSMRNLDVAFVEGAIPTASDAKLLREIRKNCKRLVAVGSCAITGMPAAQRNCFNAQQKKEIAFIVRRFTMAKKVRTIKEVVPVDYQVPGCPMQEEKFLDVLNRCLKEFT